MARELKTTKVPNLWLVCGTSDDGEVTLNIIVRGATSEAEAIESAYRADQLMDANEGYMTPEDEVMTLDEWKEEYTNIEAFETCIFDLE